MSRAPNIVLTLADDQPAYALGASGNSVLKTPALDALAARGARFSQASHPGAHIGAVCAPNRAMLFTGKHFWKIPNIIKGWWEDKCERFEAADPEPANLTMLGEHLRRKGYYTFATGKWHNMPFTFHRNFRDGEAIWFHGGNTLQKDLMEEKQLPERKYGRGRPEFLKKGKEHWKHVVHSYDATGEWSPWNAYHDPRHGVEIFTEAAVNFIESYDGDKPFFLYVPYYAPHNPLEAESTWHDKYRASMISLPINYQKTITFDNGGLLCKERMESGWKVTENQAKEWIAGLYALTAQMDDGIRRIHDALERKGLTDNTLVIHSSDHGKSSGHHGLQGKWSLYEEDLRVPLIMAGPDVPKGMTSDALVYQHDLFPTLLELAGIDTESDFQSLWPLLKSSASKGRTFLHAADRASMRSIRDARYKLIEYRHDTVLKRGSRYTEFFDLEKDPYELNNLYEKPEQRDYINELRAVLMNAIQSNGDPCSNEWLSELTKEAIP